MNRSGICVVCKRVSVLTLDMCPAHYEKQRRYGDPLAGYRHGEALQYFHETLRTPQAHEGWPYGHRGGYGYIYFQRRGMGVHHLACIVAYGDPVGDANVARHSCRNLDCFWPEHLSWGTIQDNVDDMVRDGTRASGERCPGAKLTLADVREIRRLRTAGGTLKELAGQFGVSSTHVGEIAAGRKWRGA